MEINSGIVRDGTAFINRAPWKLATFPSLPVLGRWKCCRVDGRRETWQSHTVSEAYFLSVMFTFEPNTRGWQYDTHKQEQRSEQTGKEKDSVLLDI